MNMLSHPARSKAMAPIAVFSIAYVLHVVLQILAATRPGIARPGAVVLVACLAGAVIWYGRTLDEVHQAIAARANAVAFWTTFLVLFAVSAEVPGAGALRDFAPLWTVPVASWLVGYAIALWRAR